MNKAKFYTSPPNKGGGTDESDKRAKTKQTKPNKINLTINPTNLTWPVYLMRVPRDQIL